jgi:hypothetical protein
LSIQKIFAVRLLAPLWMPKLVVLPWIWLATIPCMLLPLVIIFLEVRRGNREVRVLALPMLFYGAMIIWIGLWLGATTAVPAGGPSFLRLTTFPVWQLGPVSLTGVEVAEMRFLLTTAVVLADRARRSGTEQARLVGEFAAAQQLQKLLVPPPSMTVGSDSTR